MSVKLEEDLNVLEICAMGNELIANKGLSRLVSDVVLEAALVAIESNDVAVVSNEWDFENSA